MLAEVADQDSKMAKVIYESRWSVTHKCDPNYPRKALGRHCQELSKNERQMHSELGKRSWDSFNYVLHQHISRDKTIKMWENALYRDSEDHSKCDHPAQRGQQWKNRDTPEGQ
jgi:hypothetical protein